MADDNLKKDPNFVTTMGAVDNTSAKDVVNLVADSITKRLLVDSSNTRATTLTVYNVRIDLANTEYSQSLPAGTKKFKIYMVTSDKLFPYAYTLKYSNLVGGSSATPVVIPPMGFDIEEDVNLTDTTLYFQTPTATSSPYIIIKCWT